MSHSARLAEAKAQGRSLWRSYLINGHPGAPALLDEYPIKPGNIVVRRRKPLDGTTRGVSRSMNGFVDLFAIFFTPEDLYNYIFGYLEPKDRDMYEIVEEKQYQKARFDIELTLAESKLTASEADTVVSDIVKEIKFITDNLFPKEDTGFREYTSHGTDKRSVHIVLTKLCHATSQEARKFYELVIGYMSPKLREFVDVMVYSTRQNFRLMYCAKLGTDRFKTLAGPVRQPNLQDFKESLLGWLEGCRLIILS